eukprot:TRINITY_DN6114_c0_g1_i1.p1 TRINITY_DN6114_c0_g1~~TRINITY_DN6114_c0_g1_i1.p1  ORF type:complete len:288 (-),score=66.93 TRINITY_DN6114_c0_g1_i1:167-1030(-)
MSAWAVATGASMFRKKNAIKTFTSIALCVVGIVLLGLYTRSQDTVEAVGQGLFEIGALFFISKFFFMAEDSELMVERLEKELKEARASPGMGMAMSYFYNFVVPTAANLNSDDENGGVTDIDAEIKRGEFQKYQLSPSKLLLFIPRNLEGSDMKAFLREIATKNQVLQGKPKEKPGKATHRPMFVYFLKWNTEAKTCSGLFDIPTIISSCWDRNQDESIEHKTDILKEIIDFQNQLVELVKSNPLTRGKVKLISVPSTPLNFELLEEAGSAYLSESGPQMELTEDID